MSAKEPRAAALVGLILILSLACSTVQGAVDDLAPIGVEAPSVSNTGDLRAEVTSAVSVQLTWQPVSGANANRIDVRFEGTEFLVLAEIPGDQTEFEDIVLPGSPPMTFRVIAMTAAGETEVGTSSVALPELAPNPLVVEVQYFEPTMVAIPTYDPQNPMGSLPPGFDPSNPEAFDLSSLIQDVSVSQAIGPEGGRIAVTSPTQEIYNLDVPAGAVNQELIFTLTPVKSIPGLPLSGGLVGAVQIKPEGFVFDLPAVLTIERTTTAPNPAAPLTLGFAVSSFSQEFSLYPVDVQSGTGSEPEGAGHLARLASRPHWQATASSMTVGGSGTYGIGAGSTGDVRAQGNRVPSDPGAQMAQTNAQQRVTNPGIGAYEQTGSAIYQNMLTSDSAGTLARATSDLEQYWQDRGAEYTDESNARLIDLYVSRLKTLLNRSKGDCLTRDDLVAGELADKLRNGATDFWKRVQQAYGQKYGAAGQQLIDDLVNGKLSCSFTLEITSTIKAESDNGWALATVQATPPIPLSHFRGGVDPTSATGFRLAGYGWVQYTNYEFQVKGCPVTKVTQYPKVSLTVSGLFPEFDQQGPVQDFWFRYMELGANYTLDLGVSSTEDRRGCKTSLLFMGGGDLWAGGFILLHFPSADAGIRGWTQTSPNYPLVYTKEYTDYSTTLPGGAGKVTENATYTITIRRGPK